MKKKLYTLFIIIAAALSFCLTAEAQTQVTIRVANYARPLVERWIEEYGKTHSDISLSIAKNKTEQVALTLTTTDAHSGTTVAVGRTAVLPVTTEGSEAAGLLGTKRLNAKKLKNLFFLRSELDDEGGESKAEKALHVYSGNSQLSASRLYAEHFKQEATNYKGKKISGDDSFLITAISRDALGVTINSLSNIFDLQSRQLRQGLQLLPLDLDKTGRQIIDQGRLDDILTLLEQQEYAEIPTASVALAINAELVRGTTDVLDFVRWVLTDGQQYIHEYGLLKLPQKELTRSLEQTERRDLACR